MVLRSVCLLPIFVLVRVYTVPPEACFANFRWDDCGTSPVPVMYYWKPGSRCEVALWRGCLPNPNMFNDEYECVTTCIFSARALPEDYHSIHENEIEGETELTTESGNATEVGSESTGSGSEATGSGSESTGAGGNVTEAATVASDAKGGGSDGNATVADNKATGAGGANSTGGGGAANSTAGGPAVTTVGGAAATTVGDAAAATTAAPA